MNKMLKTTIVLLLIISLFVPTTVLAADNPDLSRNIHNAFESFQKLNKPSLKNEIVGTQVVLTWDKIPGANQYSIACNGKVATTKKNKWTYPMNEGTTITFEVRAEDSTGKYTSSEYSSATITLEDVAPYAKLIGQTVADKTSLTKFLSDNNLAYEELENTDYTIIHVYIKDTFNENVKDKVGRGLAGATVGIINGLKEGYKSTTIKSIASNALANYAETENGKQAAIDTAKETITDVIKSGVKGAALNSLTYTAQDTNIHYLYFFNKNDKSNMCEKLVANMEYNCHENYKKRFDSVLKQTSDGIHYGFVNNEKKILIVDINRVDTDTVYPKWYTIVIPVKINTK